jgi:hypothetical protein
MATKRPASESNEVTPTAVDTDEVTPGAVAADPTLAASDSVAAEPVSAEPVYDEPVAAPETVIEPVVPRESVAPSQQVVYVEAPKPFVAKGNRGFGVLIALVSTVIFAVLYAVAEVIAELVNHVSSVDVGFLSDSLDFYAPVLMFAIAFILLVLIVNRAGWAAHVVGSLFVALIVYFGSTGIVLLLHAGQIPSNRVSEAYSQVLVSSGAIIAGLLAREVSLWMGFAVAARGRRVRARNVDARVLYDQEIATKRAEYERANARTATAANTETSVSEPVAVERPVVEEPVDTTTTAP